MAKPRLLDLFCGAGGVAMGYHRAGFDVWGVDIEPQPRYPFWFRKADAMTFPLDGFDAIHASPPCQAYSQASLMHGENRHPKLIEPIRERLRATGKPYVIENVVGAPLECPILLCGTMFDLTTPDEDGAMLFLKRHRLFESSVWLTQPMPCRCVDFKKRGLLTAGVYGGGSNGRIRRSTFGYMPPTKQRRELIGAPWMTLPELSQSIPPAYTQWIGEQVLW